MICQEYETNDSKEFNSNLNIVVFCPPSFFHFCAER